MDCNPPGSSVHGILQERILEEVAISSLRKSFKPRDRIQVSHTAGRFFTVDLVKTMVFPVVMYGCESWTIKKPECQRIDAFELLCWRRLLRVPWTAKRSNQPIPKEISPEY